MFKFRLSRLQLYEKVTLTQMFSCEYCKVFKNNSANVCFSSAHVNALRAGLIHPLLENTLSMSNLPVPLF